MLTESEIKLLRQSKVEIAQRVSELAGLRIGSTPATEKATVPLPKRTARAFNQEIK